MSTMADTTHTQTEIEEQISLKLLVDEEAHKVLFAEAEKDFVDILCSFLTLPLGTIARLVAKESHLKPVTIGCLSSLYQSVADLDEKYLRTVTCKEMLLQPRNTLEDYCRTLKLNIDDTEPTKYFMCNNSAKCDYHLLSTFKNQRCQCGNLLDRSVLLKDDTVCNGFVENGPLFIITDELIVIPISMDMNYFYLLKSFGIKNMSSVELVTMNINKKQVLDLLKCSLLSTSTLTDFFFKEQSFFDRRVFSPCDALNSNSIRIKLNLFMRNSDGKILFALGNEDFVDFLFSFLTFPLGGVIRLLSGNSVGSIDGLLGSIVGLDYKYFMSNATKDRLVDPCIAPQFKLSNQMLEISEPSPESLYCSPPSSFMERITRKPVSIIHQVKSHMDITNQGGTILTLVDPKSSAEEIYEGYVKETEVFMVTDDLVVKPISHFSTTSLLNGLDIPPSYVTEKVVYIGVKEGLCILRAALTSRSALTNGLEHMLNAPVTGLGILSRLFLF